MDYQVRKRNDRRIKLLNYLILSSPLVLAPFDLDPFGRVIFLNQSAVTERLENTLCPTWDQTLIFEEISIHGEPNQVLKKPPMILIEFFDHDQIVKLFSLN